MILISTPPPAIIWSKSSAAWVCAPLRRKNETQPLACAVMHPAVGVGIGDSGGRATFCVCSGRRTSIRQGWAAQLSACWLGLGRDHRCDFVSHPTNDGGRGTPLDGGARLGDRDPYSARMV